MKVDEGRDRLMSDEFRDVIGRFASGVTVITTVQDDIPLGATASAVSSLSLEPPMLLICMNRESSTGQAVAAAGHFAVNILDEDQADVALLFARKGEKFSTVSTTPGERGDPLIDRALATIECSVVEVVPGGTHWVFIAEVERASARHGSPLAYFRGQFGRLQLAQDETAFDILKSRIVNRELPIGVPLSLDDLASELDTPRGSVYHALARLTGEGLVTRNDEGRFIARPFSRKAVESGLRARHAILLGVAMLTSGTLTDEEQLELRRRLDAFTPTDGDRVRSYPEWRENLVEFQRFLIGHVGGDALAEAFARTNVAAMIATRLGEATEAGEVHASFHAAYAELVGACEANDTETAQLAIRRIVELAQEMADVAFGTQDEI
jgi:flavin reductase (DIM6/NTAB) family NADH-FMN oxidoreductase RutF/DNA-binding GntR family transcriptional regulator